MGPWSLLLSLAVAATAACIGEIPDAIEVADAPDAGVTPTKPDGAPVAPGTPDGAPAPEAPDGAPAPATYPSGPYGTRAGDVMANLSWMGYVDDDGDGNPFDEPARMVSLDEYFAGNDPDARIILINSSAGWCGACQDEASHLDELDAEYRARGGRIISTLYETTSGAPATVDFARSWGESFGLPCATLADPSDKLGPYYVGSSVPMNMFVDATTMRIVDVSHGFDAGYTRSVFNAYVE